MKKLLLIFTIVILLFSCKKDNAILPDSTELQQQEGWSTEPFKSEYTIQFPDYYTGGYIQGFEGGSFSKVRDNSAVSMSYGFSDGLQMYDFGDTLTDESATSIDVPQGDILMFLNQRTDFTYHGSVEGILFHNDAQNIRRGELYWKDNGLFRDALTIYYDADLEGEVICILKTIQHK